MALHPVLSSILTARPLPNAEQWTAAARQLLGQFGCVGDDGFEWGLTWIDDSERDAFNWKFRAKPSRSRAISITYEGQISLWLANRGTQVKAEVCLFLYLNGQRLYSRNRDDHYLLFEYDFDLAEWQKRGWIFDEFLEFTDVEKEGDYFR